jgi:hypothetical protein
MRLSRPNGLKSRMGQAERLFKSAAFALLLTAAAGSAVAQAPSTAPAAPSAAARAQIEALITRIEAQQGLRFIRNGRSYSAAQAAEFLRRKWPAQCAALQTVEQFIDQCASRSSTTGKPYEIRQGSQTRSAGVVLREWANLPVR